MQRATPRDRHLQLMTTCLCDAFYPEVAQATVEVLEHVNCRVSFPENQTCCGQPAFNAGDWDAARKVIRHTVKVFDGAEPVVSPSGSCAAMVNHGALLALEEESDLPAGEELASRTWELCDYLVNGLGVTSWPGRFDGRVTVHRSCHTRGSGAYDAALTLLRSIEGLTVLPFDEEEQCCGFGGTFSVSFPHISAEMGQLKLEKLTAEKPDYVASLDMACMMHFGGMMDKQGEKTPRLHVAQILAQALASTKGAST